MMISDGKSKPERAELESLISAIETEALSLGGTGEFPAFLQICVLGSIGFLILYFVSF